MTTRLTVLPASLTLLLAAICVPSVALGQFGEPWTEFEDPETGEFCGVINTFERDLTVIDRTGEVVDVNSEFFAFDTEIPGLIVDVDNRVLFNNLDIGEVIFADDADGLPALFMVSDDGFIIELDAITDEPFESDLLPEEVAGTSCDACDFVDDDGGQCRDVVVVRDGGGGGGSRIICGAGLLPVILAPLGLSLVRRTGRRFVLR